MPALHTRGERYDRSVLAALPRVAIGFIALCLVGCKGDSSAEASDAGPQATTFAALAAEAERTLIGSLYGAAKWNLCLPESGCPTTDSDWGADALTGALYFRWMLNSDPAILPILSALNGGGPTFTTCELGPCTGWSDIPMWDSIAASREYAATGEASALSRARAAFGYVSTANAFGIGACPAVDYQAPGGAANKLKTLETDANYIKAALLLYEETKEADFLTKAVTKYASVQQYFKDPSVPLYTVYVIDDGSTCTQIPRRFFGSVNGVMIESGLLLAAATGDASYKDDAVATAMAVDQDLSDPSGIYEDFQAENDVTLPLVLAFYQLATTGEAFARDWILRNAAASFTDLTSSGSYGRFWGGPAPTGTTTAWQMNGGFALVFAAAALAPSHGPSASNMWSDATMTTDDITTLPATLTFTGSAIALYGTIGEECCEPGHARVVIDGTESFDQTGIWQNKSSSGRSLPGSVLFAWRWPTSGKHTLGFLPGIPNSKEGGAFLHVRSYALVP
jgi:hypothetical protein